MTTEYELPIEVRPQRGRVICLIQVGKKWVIGWNDREKSSPKWRKRFRNGVTYTRHAESHALTLAARAGGKIKKVIVLRWTKKGKLAMAKPCRFCQNELLIKNEIPARRIFYSDENGEIKKFNDSAIPRA